MTKDSNQKTHWLPSIPWQLSGFLQKGWPRGNSRNGHTGITGIVQIDMLEPERQGKLISKAGLSTAPGFRTGKNSLHDTAAW